MKYISDQELIVCVGINAITDFLKDGKISAGDPAKSILISHVSRCLYDSFIATVIPFTRLVCSDTENGFTLTFNSLGDDVLTVDVERLTDSTMVTINSKFNPTIEIIE